MKPPGVGDTVADKDRILQALKPKYGNVYISISTLKSYYKLLRNFDWKLIVTMVWNGCCCEIIGGNTTMIHFLFGIYPWFIFYTPYTPSFNRCDFISGRDSGLPFSGLVYFFPSVANYLGGDIISDLLTAQIHKGSELSLYMDIGTNGEMILGNNEFMIGVA